MGARYSEAELEWLRGAYPLHGSRQALADAFAEAFPGRPSRTVQALTIQANKMGLYVQRARGCDGSRRVERRVRWRGEPEMTAWMLEHDRGQRTTALSEEFRAEFGFGLTQTQISTFRGQHGTQQKRDNANSHAHNRQPVGAVRDTGKGYRLVKVRENPTVPGSKDNWRPEHVLAWERANGRELPEGQVVLAGDGDTRNTDPGNLVAVPKKLVGIINSDSVGRYWDGESLRAVAASAALKHAEVNAGMRMTRACEVCGAQFLPTSRANPGQKTCPACLEKGMKARGRRKAHAVPRTCAVCGRPFTTWHDGSRPQRRCPECVARDPKASVEYQIEREGRNAR